ncbi:MAG: hypothetical protein ACRDNZ_19740 [Streptosporangiaceae bacterium]
MPDGSVNADPESVRKLAGALARYERDVAAASRSVQAALASANWHDRQKQQFEQRYRDLQRSIDGFMSSEVQAMARSLNELTQRLEEIRRMRM